MVSIQTKSKAQKQHKIEEKKPKEYSLSQKMMFKLWGHVDISRKKKAIKIEKFHICEWFP